jgi:hypothetical protein
MGDGVLVYFGYPQAPEHDAERAVRAGRRVNATRCWLPQTSVAAESGGRSSPAGPQQRDQQDLRQALSRVNRCIPPAAGLVLETSQCMRWLVKQFELSGQRRDTQIGLGAREVGFKCVQFVSVFRQPPERLSLLGRHWPVVGRRGPFRPRAPAGWRKRDWPGGHCPPYPQNSLFIPNPPATPVFHGRHGLSLKHLHLTPDVFEPARG